MPLYVSRADAPVASRTEWTSDGSTWHQIATEERGTFTVAEGFWDVAGRGLTWITRGGQTTLYGAISRKAGNLVTGTLTLGGIPQPTQSWQGILQSGNARVVSVQLDTGRILTMLGFPVASASPWLCLDGLTYRSQ